MSNALTINYAVLSHDAAKAVQGMGEATRKAAMRGKAVAAVFADLGFTASDIGKDNPELLQEVKLAVAEGQTKADRNLFIMGDASLDPDFTDPKAWDSKAAAKRAKADGTAEKRNAISRDISRTIGNIRQHVGDADKAESGVSSARQSKQLQDSLLDAVSKLTDRYKKSVEKLPEGAGDEMGAAIAFLLKATEHTRHVKEITDEATMADAEK